MPNQSDYTVARPLPRTRREALGRIGVVGTAAASAALVTSALEPDSAAANAYAVLGNDGTVGGAGGSPLNKIIAQVSGGSGTTTTSGQTVNTGSFFESNSGEDPTLTTGFHGIQDFSGNVVTWGIANDYTDSNSGSIFQVASCVYNPDSTSTVAFFAASQGLDVWGFNSVVEALGTGSKAVGYESDFAIVDQGQGQALGVGIHAQGAAGNPSSYLNMLADAALSGPKYGIVIESDGQNTVTTSASPAAQTPEVSTTLITSAAIPAGTASQGMFAWGGNYYSYNGFTTTNVHNDTLANVTQAAYYSFTSVAIPANAKVPIGRQPLWNTGGIFTLLGTITTQFGFDLSLGIFASEAIKIPVNSTVAGDGLVVLPTGGGAATGAGIVFEAPTDNSTMQYLIRASGSSTATYGFDLSGWSYTDSAINLGDNNIRVGTTSGCQIGLAPRERLGFYGTAPIVRPTANNVTSGYATGTSTTVTVDGTFTGGSGSTKYTVADIVAALKNLGLITQ